jgi:HTH-type transcriptional regulator, glycine betaine synthesis regulator
MAIDLNGAREDLIRELGRLSAFAGFNKAMGQIYALLYLSDKPISLTEIAFELGISKGNASLNTKTMERWGLIHPVSIKGDRRDYYQAETDFWKIVRDIINERDRKEINHVLESLNTILGTVRGAGDGEKEAEILFYKERLEQMVEFGNAVVQLMQASLAMNNFHLNSFKRLQEKEQAQRIVVED